MRMKRQAQRILQVTILSRPESTFILTIENLSPLPVTLAPRSPFGSERIHTELIRAVQLERAA